MPCRMPPSRCRSSAPRCSDRLSRRPAVGIDEHDGEDPDDERLAQEVSMDPEGKHAERLRPLTKEAAYQRLSAS